MALSVSSLSSNSLKSDDLYPITYPESGGQSPIPLEVHTQPALIARRALKRPPPLNLKLCGQPRTPIISKIQTSKPRYLSDELSKDPIPSNRLILSALKEINRRERISRTVNQWQKKAVLNQDFFFDRMSIFEAYRRVYPMHYQPKLCWEHIFQESEVEETHGCVFAHCLEELYAIGLSLNPRFKREICPIDHDVEECMNVHANELRLDTRITETGELYPVNIQFISEERWQQLARSQLEEYSQITSQQLQKISDSSFPA